MSLSQSVLNLYVQIVTFLLFIPLLFIIVYLSNTLFSFENLIDKHTPCWLLKFLLGDDAQERMS